MGPLRDVHNLYCCTMVDVCTGLRLAHAFKAPNQQAIIATCWAWISSYGTPVLISSDQGTHFTGSLVQKLATIMGILWDIYLFIYLLCWG